MVKKILIICSAVLLINPAFAGSDKAGKGKSEAKRVQTQSQKVERTQEQQQEMEQRKLTCQNNSSKAECAGWQKGRNKAP